MRQNGPGTSSRSCRFSLEAAAARRLAAFIGDQTTLTTRSHRQSQVDSMDRVGL